MITIRFLLATTAWSGAVAATLAALAADHILFAWTGIIAALAAIAWGLTFAIEKDHDTAIADECDRVWDRRDNTDQVIDAEPPFEPVARRPFWDTDTFGAPE